MVQAIKKGISRIFDWLLYTFLSENQKEKISRLFSERQKELLRKITQHGKRRQQKLHIKHLKDHLYSLGFRTKALQQLQSLLETSDDSYMKRLAAWELALWFANLETEEGAKESLAYIEKAKQGEKDTTQLRRITIVEAECLLRTGQKELARTIVLDLLKKEQHPDLYLSLANLETDIERRMQWINKVYAMYRLNPIAFANMNEPTYEGLRMGKEADKVVKDVKVSIIIPAYNAGEGLEVAVESILAQTWKNIEVIIVDDCSTDDTFTIAKEFAKKDSRIIVRQTEENSGPYVARNIALNIATGDFVTINDADDWSHEEKIAIQAQYLIENPSVIANTSSHARLTEDLTLYRRGTPGRYLFPNMSSIMFRRKKVMEKLGYWDSVRFAADGEFKRRLLRQFGEHAFVDLETGPLSLPKQAVSSLTSSSAFGYSGFFMGARKEYVESFQHYYQEADSLYYPFPQKERLFAVPEPMWPKREWKNEGARKFDIVVAGDFRNPESVKNLTQIKRANKSLSIGLMQLYEYNLTKPIEICGEVRKVMHQHGIQMLVYGEKVSTEKLIIIDYNVLLDEQTYMPTIHPKTIEILVKENEEIDILPEITGRLKTMYEGEMTIIPNAEKVREQLLTYLQSEQPFQLAKEDWVLLYGKE